MKLYYEKSICIIFVADGISINLLLLFYMSLLFSVTPKGVILFCPEILNVSPHLAIMNDTEKAFIALAYSATTLWWCAPEEERISRAKERTFKEEPLPNLKLKKYVNAIEEFVSGEYSSKRELMRTYERKLVSLSRALETEEDDKKIVKLISGMDSINIALNQMREEVTKEMSAQYATIKGGGDLSFLSNYIANNKAAYERIRAGQRPIKNK